jgi:hypothetical protein
MPASVAAHAAILAQRASGKAGKGASNLSRSGIAPQLGSVPHRGVQDDLS